MKFINCLWFLFFFAVSCEDVNENKTEKTAIGISKYELGRKLFFDKRLSLDNSISCASCHRPELAFTDGLRFSLRSIVCAL